MSENKTVKYHIPEQGIYLYARTSEGKTEMIVKFLVLRRKDKI